MKDHTPRIAIAAALALLAATAPPARADQRTTSASTQAVLALFTWTQPSMGTKGWLVGYAFEQGNAHVAWRPVNAYDHPGALPGIFPGQDGMPAHAYIPITTDPNSAFGWRSGGTRIRVRCIVDSTFGAGSARDTLEPSNEVVIVEGFPDTLGTDGRVAKRPDPNAVLSGELVFQRTLSDPTSADAGPFWHFETWQAEHVDLLCSIDWKPLPDGRRRYWCRRGAVEVCP